MNILEARGLKMKNPFQVCNRSQNQYKLKNSTSIFTEVNKHLSLNILIILFLDFSGAMDLTVDNGRFTNGSENEKMFNDIDMKSEDDSHTFESYGNEVNQL